MIIIIIIRIINTGTTTIQELLVVVVPALLEVLRWNSSITIVVVWRPEINGTKGINPQSLKAFFLMGTTAMNPSNRNIYIDLTMVASNILIREYSITNTITTGSTALLSVLLLVVSLSVVIYQYENYLRSPKKKKQKREGVGIQGEAPKL